MFYLGVIETLIFFVEVINGNTGCGVFKGGIQKWKGFWLKINYTQMKLLNFENWSSCELSEIGHYFRK